MKLTDENIAEFQMLYKKHYGKEISKEVALDKGLRLIRLIEIVLKHDAKKRIAQSSQPEIIN